MLSRKSFAAGVPAVSMDELAAFADSYGPRARRADGSLEARAGGRFERAEPRARGGLFADGPPEGYSPEGYSPERYFGARSRSREPLADAERAWSPEDAPLPRLVSRPAAGEHPGRGGSLETPARRGAPYYAWSPPATYRARAPRGDDEDELDDALPPYSERELSRVPSHRGRDLSDKRRKKEPAKKPVRPRDTRSRPRGAAGGRSSRRSPAAGCPPPRIRTGDVSLRGAGKGGSRRLRVDGNCWIINDQPLGLSVPLSPQAFGGLLGPACSPFCACLQAQPSPSPAPLG